MHARIRTNRRAVALLLAAMLTLLPSVVLAGGHWSATAPIQQGNANCGVDLPQLPVMGTVDFTRKGQSIAMTFHLDGAAPGSSYQAELWSGDCHLVQELGTVTTDGSGDGSATFSTRARGQSFFATVYGDNGYNDTTIVP